MNNVATVGNNVANVLSNIKIDGNTVVGVGLISLGVSFIIHTIADSGCELNLVLKDFKLEIKQPELNVIDTE